MSLPGTDGAFEGWGDCGSPATAPTVREYERLRRGLSWTPDELRCHPDMAAIARYIACTMDARVTLDATLQPGTVAWYAGSELLRVQRSGRRAV